MEGSMKVYMLTEDQMERLLQRLDSIEETIRVTDRPPVIGSVWSVARVAERLGVTRHTVYQWAREGKLRSVRTGGRVLIPESALTEFLEGSTDDVEENN